MTLIKYLWRHAAPITNDHSNASLTSFLIQQRERYAATIHRQETVDCLKRFNARRKLKVHFVAKGVTPLGTL